MQEGRLEQGQVKLFAEGHLAVLWWYCSAAFQHCLRGKIDLSPSRVLKGGALAFFFFLFGLSVFEQSEIAWTGEASSFQRSCQINFPCWCMCGAA